MSCYARNELVAIWEYNYSRVGIVESIYKMMSHMRSISLLTGSEKKIMITEIVLSCLEDELEEFVSETIEFLFKNLIEKHKKSFFTCIR